jgi:hypothetical protein
VHGFVAGIVMLDSDTPRIPGDPGHAGTFAFPVCYATAHGFGVNDMLEYRPERLGPVIAAVKELEQAGVGFVAADCGLFSIYQRDLAAAGDVPFLGSALSLVPLAAQSLSSRSAVGIVTGHTDYLRAAHLAAVGIDPARVVVSGMEECSEFCRVVIDGGGDLDIEALREGTVEAALRLTAGSRPIGAVVLECSNLATFRSDVQQAVGVPVFDMVSLIESFADGYRERVFAFPYRTGREAGSVS